MLHPRRFASHAACLTLALVASCDRCGGGSNEPKDAEPVGAADARPPASDASDASSDASTAEDAAPAPDDASTTAADASPLDGGSPACRLAYGPAEQPFRGTAAMVTTANELRLVANDGGKPRIFRVPLGPPPRVSAPVLPVPKPSSFLGMRWPPCELAGRWAYCQGPGGIVYRTTLGATDTKQITKSQPGTRIAAAPLGPDHAIVATLESHRTTEGAMLQAFVTLDEGEPQRLSDEGAGATVLRLVARGDRAVALSLDARTAMVPVHARTVSLRSGALALDRDIVLFVGGPPERGIELTPAAAGKAIFALVPLARDTTDFGMAAIPIADPPNEDVKPAWSAYPNGLDPAPIGATLSAPPADGGRETAWVARVRPAERAAGSPRVLELGRLDAAGRFTSSDVIVTRKRITDVAVVADAYGSVWVLYGDSSTTWLERRVCP